MGKSGQIPNMAQLCPEMPNGHLKVYNAGMVMFTNKGMQLARENLHFSSIFQDYIDPVV